MSTAGEGLGAAIKSGSTFAISDTLTFGPGNSAWTKSRLDHSVLLPANPHMLGAGLGPFDSVTSVQGTVDPKNWHSDPGTDRYSYGFYWLLPVSQPEHAKANTDATWNMFADLVEKSHEIDGDDFTLTYDLLR
jgi:hypothetical protein